MIQLSYSISIKASKETVWHVILDPECFREWAKAFSESSQLSGLWQEGSYIKFFDLGMGGTKALVEKLIPEKYLLLKHVAVIDKDGNEDITTETALKWNGITETYELSGDESATTLKIDINTHEDYVNMFSNAWPEAIKTIKSICER